MLKFGAKMIAPVVVDRIDCARGPDDFHTLHLDCGTQLRARTILAATGVSWRQLDVEGVERRVMAVVADPDLRLEEQLGPRDGAGGDRCPDLGFVEIGRRRVDHSVSGTDGFLDGRLGHLGWSLEDAKPQGR